MPELIILENNLPEDTFSLLAYKEECMIYAAKPDICPAINGYKKREQFSSEIFFSFQVSK